MLCGLLCHLIDATPSIRGQHDSVCVSMCALICMRGWECVVPSMNASIHTQMNVRFVLSAFAQCAQY
jgi:hypothetical protein